MPLKQLIAPIAAATIVTAFWFAAMWRGHQHERNSGKLPRRYEAAFFGYLTALGLILYAIHDGPLTSAPSLFGAAMIAEGLGIVITYGLVHAFVLTRGRPWSERAVPMAFSLILAAGMVGAVLIT